jgi:glycosyltransferase involved in cell wall biosynthesis
MTTNAQHPKSNTPQIQPSVSLIIPTYQAESFIIPHIERLETYAQNTPIILEIILIDDGSQDQTPIRINQYLKTHPHTHLKFIALNQNVGKGAAIKKGVQIASGNIVIFTDCDLPYSFSDINALIHTLTTTQADVVIGSRMHPESVYHIRSQNLSYIYIRHTSGRLFNFLINLFTRLHMADTQAGLKGFTQEAAKWCFGKMTISGFAFDIDLLVCAKKNHLHIETIPLNFNYDSEMSTVSFLKHAVLMTLSVLHIVFKKLTGHYTRPSNP